jgi:hypothetical protein
VRPLPLVPGLLALVVVLGACSAGTPPAAAPGAASSPPIDGVVVTPRLEPSHVEGPVRYEQVPPVGGPHNPVWVRCEVWDSPVPAELAVHSLEHGGVWLAHAPDLPPAQAQRLAALHDLDATTREYVLVSPYEGLPSPVTAAAWGVSLAVDDATDPRLEQFVRRYAGGPQGGEPGAPCTSAPTAVDAAQARALIAEQS